MARLVGSSPSSASRRLQPKQQPAVLPAEGHSSGAAGVNRAATGGSFLWTWLLCGLLATLVNIFYEAQTILGGRLHQVSQFEVMQGALEVDSPEQAVGDQVKPIPAPPALNKKKQYNNPQRRVQTLDELDPEFVRDKGPVLQLVQDAGLLSDTDMETLERLPSWSDVTKLYGSEPILYGMEDGVCEQFQALPNASMHFVATAGTFNTGTNLMAELLIANCHLPKHEGGPGVRWQVLWGKHSPVDNETFRLTHRTYEDPKYLAQNIFPAVMVRDPYKWMQSMCRHPYGAHWKNDTSDPKHCPNLVNEAGEAVKVGIQYSEFTRHHTTLVEFWNEWYQAYFDAPFPRLMVRFEDLIYHPREVVHKVCECAGGRQLPHPKQKNSFQYVVDSAKKGDKAHGDVSQRTSYLDALIRYGTFQGRYKGFQEADLDYAKSHLNPKLMEALQYPFYNPHDVGAAE